MRRFTLFHRFDVDAATFWDRVLFDEALNRRVHVEHLGLPDYGIEIERRADGSRARKVRVTLRTAGNPVFRRLVGDTYEYLEHGELDVRQDAYRYRLELPGLRDRADLSGVVRLEAQGESQVLRVSAITVDVRMFGIASLAEPQIERALRDAYDKAAPFLNRALRE